MLTVQSFFDLSEFSHPDLFSSGDYVWQPLNFLKNYMDSFEYPNYDHVIIRDGVPLTEHVIIHKGQAFSYNDVQISYGDTTKGQLMVKRGGMILQGASVSMAGAIVLGGKFSLGKGVRVEPGAMIKSPAILGDMTEIRQGAYLRGYCLTGDRCVLGHTTEIKHSIFLNDAKAGHFAYLGDSILGNNANLGAGTKFANLKFLPGNVSILHKGEHIDTGRRKFGAILGDDTQTGCNSVTSPGTLLSKRSILMPNTTAKGGYYEKKSIIRMR